MTTKTSPEIISDCRPIVRLSPLDEMSRQGMLPLGYPESDIETIAASRRQSVIVWSIEDVLEVRPDLEPDHAWQVLQYAYNTVNDGVSWEALELAAADLFGCRRIGD